MFFKQPITVHVCYGPFINFTWIFSQPLSPSSQHRLRQLTEKHGSGKIYQVMGAVVGSRDLDLTLAKGELVAIISEADSRGDKRRWLVDAGGKNHRWSADWMLEVIQPELVLTLMPLSWRLPRPEALWFRLVVCVLFSWIRYLRKTWWSCFEFIVKTQAWIINPWISTIHFCLCSYSGFFLFVFFMSWFELNCPSSFLFIPKHIWYYLWHLNANVKWWNEWN